MRPLPGADTTLQVLQDEVEASIVRLGIMYRIFGRAKSEPSLKKKVAEKGYKPGGRLLQDLIGIRVVVYFPEDCEVVQRAVSGRFEVAGESVDVPGTDEFGPRRLNIVLRPPSHLWRVQTDGWPIDGTFELQIRTVLSEGWHEVEHDLRYKCAGDWAPVPEKLRKLNGTLAAIETAEWAMTSLLDGLAYHHYRARNWEAMLRHKFRLRLQGARLTSGVRELLDQDHSLGKRLWRADRSRLIDAVIASGIAIPWTLDNLVHLIVAVEGVPSEALAAMRTAYVASALDEVFGGRAAD